MSRGLGRTKLVPEPPAAIATANHQAGMERLALRPGGAKALCYGLFFRSDMETAVTLFARAEAQAVPWRT
jgi:hypothetical protein